MVKTRERHDQHKDKAQRKKKSVPRGRKKECKTYPKSNKATANFFKTMAGRRRVRERHKDKDIATRQGNDRVKTKTMQRQGRGHFKTTATTKTTTTAQTKTTTTSA